MLSNLLINYYVLKQNDMLRKVAFQSIANHPFAESMGYIKFEGM